MKQLELRNGDLVVGPGGFATVTGARRVQQDLGCAMREYLGTDRFHPRYGTVLPDYIGGYMDSEAMGLIRGEIHRVVQNYMVLQTEEITADMDAGLSPRYTPSEIVTDIGSVDVQQRYDRINVKVMVRTYAGESVTVLRSVGV